MPKHCFLVLRSDYVASTSLMRGHLCSPRCRTCLRAMCLGTTQTKRARKHMCENQWKRGAWKTPWTKQVRAWKPREKNVAPNHYKTKHLARHLCHAIFPHAHVFPRSFSRTHIRRFSRTCISLTPPEQIRRHPDSTLRDTRKTGRSDCSIITIYVHAYGNARMNTTMHLYVRICT